jgi:TolB-like protein
LGLIANIRKRRLFQILAAYAAAGFVVLEGTDQFIQNDILPAFAYPLALWWYGLGAVVAAMIGWFHGEKGAQKAPPVEIVSIGLVAVLALGITTSHVRAHIQDRAVREAAAASELDLRTVAVTYFEDLSRDGENQYVGDALTEDLIQELSRVRALDVISRNGVAPFRDGRIPVDSVARALRAGTVVTGTVEGIGDRVRVNVRLHDGQSGAEVRRVSLERPAQDLLQARDEVAQQTASSLREWLGEEITLRRQREDTQDLAAWTLAQRAERERKEGERLIHEHHDLAGAFEAFDRADDLLDRAETVDPSWVEPKVLRAQIAYRRSRLAFPPPEDAEPWIRIGIGHAERALASRPAHAQAMELRGTLQYWWYLLPLIHDAQERQATLQRARRDLEEAVRLDPTLASAFATLSHLYAWIDERSATVLAAQRAYEEDAYLETADEVLWRLIAGLYDQESFNEARRWCDVGGSRFPDHFRFAQCRLMVMTTRAAEADPETGWALVDRIRELVPGGDHNPQYAVSLTYQGGILARASLPDSANQVLRRARDLSRPEADPHRDIFLHEAAMRATSLGDLDGAIDLLKDFAAVNPGYDFSHSWWWRGVRGHPRYGELLALQQSDH